MGRLNRYFGGIAFAGIAIVLVHLGLLVAACLPGAAAVVMLGSVLLEEL